MQKQLKSSIEKRLTKCAQLEAKSAVIASNENTIEMQQMQKERLISTMLILDASLNVMCKKKQSFGCTQYRTIISEVMNETLEFSNKK